MSGSVGVARRTPWYRLHLRAMLLAAAGAGLVGWKLWSTHVPTRLYDRVDAVPAGTWTTVNTSLSGIMMESGVDLRVLIDSVPPGTDLADFSLKEARRLGIGRTSDRRSVLLVLDAASGGLRFEVGPNLEGIFPDAFVGRLLRAHVAVVQGEIPINLVLGSTMKVLQHRIRQSLLDREYDARIVTEIADSVRLAAGAGATWTGDFERPLQLEIVPDTILERILGPGATAEDALQQYRTWLSLPVYVPRARFLLPASRAFFQREIKMTPAYWDYIRLMYVNSAMKVVTRGDLAIAFGTEDPLVEPLFFRRTAEGWQMDVMAEFLHSQSIVGGWYSWTWTIAGDEYDRAFEDMLVGPAWSRRIAYGANQTFERRGDRR